MVTVYFGVDQDHAAICRYSIIFSTTDEINVENLMGELVSLVLKWAQSWLRMAGTSVSINNLPLGKP